MKITTLTNGKTYRQISANTFEVKTIRIHAETGMAIWSRVTSEDIKQQLTEAFAVNELSALDVAINRIATEQVVVSTEVLNAAVTACPGDVDSQITKVIELLREKHDQMVVNDDINLVNIRKNLLRSIDAIALGNPRMQFPATLDRQFYQKIRTTFVLQR